MALGILCAYGVLSRLGRSRGLSPDRLANLVVLLVFSGLAGARLFFVAEHWPYFRAAPAAIVRIWEGGLMFYGSIIVAGLVLVAYCARARLRMLRCSTSSRSSSPSARRSAASAASSTGAATAAPRTPGSPSATPPSRSPGTTR